MPPRPPVEPPWEPRDAGVPVPGDHSGVLANDLAGLWLAGGALGNGQHIDEALVGLSERRRRAGDVAPAFIITSMMDWLHWRAVSDADEDAPLVLGVMGAAWLKGSGPWTFEMADFVPNGVDVCVDMENHLDRDDVIGTLRPRIDRGDLHLFVWEKR